MNQPNIIPPELVETMLKDRKVRAAITKESHWYFFHLYFAHYVKYATASFQKELISLSEDESVRNLVVVAFRGSAKSTIFTMSYPLWAILGRQKKKYVLILSQTQAQAKQHMMNLRRELESNALLKNDLGPFQEESNEWGATSLVFAESNARITAVSTEQSVRGLRHGQYRPDLIIGDDLEDIASTKTREGRNKTYQWLTGEVIPAGDRDTRLIIVGNLLHEDSLIMRLKADILDKRIPGVFKAYPLLDGKHILWTGKFPTVNDVEEEKSKAANEYAWQREYLLNIVPAEDQVIDRAWIQLYDEIPKPVKIFESHGYTSHMTVWISLDLAISKRDTADYTALVPAMLYETPKGYDIYILPKIVNRRMSFPETIEICKTVNQSYRKDDYYPTFVIESVAYQEALPQQLKEEGIWEVKKVRPTLDKRSRLMLTANHIKTGRIKFPRIGAEELISQIVNFGVEKHDDLADAFSTLVLAVIEDPPSIPRIFAMSWSDIGFSFDDD